MEGDNFFSETFSSSETEQFKKTIYRLTIDLNSQRQMYEDEILRLRATTDLHVKALEESERSKQSLKSKVNSMEKQLADSNADLVQKSLEIEKLRNEVKQQRKLIATLPVHRAEDSNTHKLTSAIATLEDLTQKLTQLIHQLTNDHSQSKTVQDVLETRDVSIQTDGIDGSHIPPHVDADFHTWKSNVDSTLENTQTRLSFLDEQQSKFSRQFQQIRRSMQDFDSRIDQVKAAQDEFLHIWLS